jgi:membrane protease subunit (stomatin/prohibitin family)
MAARTAVVAGTATAVSGAVAGHQADKRQQAAQSDAYEQQQMAAQAAPAAPAQDELTAKLEQLASLHAQGILSDEEFASAKSKALGL